jgi:glucan phosphoethanolaminetransferase (alkaline phosphatase superfamily)
MYKSLEYRVKNDNNSQKNNLSFYKLILLFIWIITLLISFPFALCTFSKYEYNICKRDIIQYAKDLNICIWITSLFTIELLLTIIFCLLLFIISICNYFKKRKYDWTRMNIVRIA